MDWNSFLHNKYVRTILCVVLIGAILLGLCYPAGNMKKVQPENPLAEETVQDINVLKVGENVSQQDTVSAPGSSAVPEENKDATEGEEANNEEQKDSDSEQMKQEPEDSQPEKSEAEKLKKDEGSEKENPNGGTEGTGQENGNQGEEGGKETEIDLAAVMTWYKYGKEPNKIVCNPSETVVKNINTAQLNQDVLKYNFSMTGKNARYVEIQEVSVARGDGVYKKISSKGDITIELPEGQEQRDYTFQVKARVKKDNKDGLKAGQEMLFTYVLQCGNSLDLEMSLTWKSNDAGKKTVTCPADAVKSFPVKSYELTDRKFIYTLKLTGSLAKDAEITEASYTTDSGQAKGALDKKGGTLVLQLPPGENTETYQLSFTVKTAKREVQYQYTLVYQEVLDVQLTMNWWEKGTTKRNLICRPTEVATQQIKNNQLGGGGSLPYEFALTGNDAKGGRILRAEYTSDADDGGILESKGSLPMELPENSTSNTYHITVTVLVKGQNLRFEIVLYYANDVSLQMQYTVREKGADTARVVLCENGKTRTAEAIYDDQLQNDLLSYTMSIAGSDGEKVKITSVNCYQSGSGRTVALSQEGEIKLLQKSGKTGENAFKVMAEDEEGKTYRFTINIPYKHKGSNTVKITTNLREGQDIINDTKTNLTVKAWSEDSSGNVLSYIPANGTDTKLIVKLDEKEITYTSSSGKSSEYDLYPENPKKGDTNSHTLTIYAEDSYGNYGELTLNLKGQRKESGQKTGKAKVYIDLTVLGIGVLGPVDYTVLADEPVSYTIAKAVLGKDTGDPFGAAEETFGFGGRYAGTLDDGFYLQSLNTGRTAKALEGSKWPGASEKAVLDAIDKQFGKGTGLATLWRCLYRNGLNKSSGSGKTYGEFDYTSGSGWMYSIGGSTYYPGQSMSSVYLQDGDVLTLRYTLAYGWDVGGGTPGYGSTVGYCVSASNGKIHINHRMEKVTNKDGSTSHVCKCCGLVEDCLHEHVKWVDQKDGTHLQVCSDCGTAIGDPEDHSWENSGGDGSDKHKCSKCGAVEEHKWKKVEGTNTATCTEDGIQKEQCSVCQAVREVKTSAKGHTYDKRWNYTKDGHYRKCSTCGEKADEEKHEYVYDDELGDFECKTCHALHHDDVGCTDLHNLTIKSATCEKIEYHCSQCGYDFVRKGSFPEYHSYKNGKCEYCGEKDPDAAEENTGNSEQEQKEKEKEEQEEEQKEE